MSRKFSEVLADYLEERERQNGDYYDDRFIGEKTQGCYRMIDLEKELDDMVQGVKE